jgi:hypothetical protein
VSTECRTADWAGDLPLSSRDFDYGVGDDLRTVERQVRAEIAARIRRAAWLDPVGTQRERLAYEQAALIAEGTN